MPKTIITLSISEEDRQKMIAEFDLICKKYGMQSCAVIAGFENQVLQFTLHQTGSKHTPAFTAIGQGMNLSLKNIYGNKL